MIRETMLARPNVPRTDPNMVDFALVIGSTVPPYFRVVEVPKALVEIHPEWRGDMYLVAGDDIVVMDRSRRIVATLPGDFTMGQGNPSPPNAAGRSSIPQRQMK